MLQNTSSRVQHLTQDDLAIIVFLMKDRPGSGNMFTSSNAQYVDGWVHKLIRHHIQPNSNKVKNSKYNKTHSQNDVAIV